MERPAFFTRTGALTSYALCCGYCELYNDEARVRRVRLWHEHGAYHVLCNVDGRQIAWETYHLLHDAHKAYARLCTRMKGSETNRDIIGDTLH